MILLSYGVLVLVKHGSFLFAYFLVQMKNLEKTLEICACPVAVCYISIAVVTNEN